LIISIASRSKHSCPDSTVVEYAVDRLAKLGITDCFGIPGDYAFPFNNAIAAHETIKWLGCSNELNASYARVVKKLIRIEISTS